MKTAIQFLASLILGLARALIIVALALPTALSPASAQFASQSTWIAVPGGTVNAITLAVANWNRNLPGVPINFLPIGDSTTAVTVVVNGVGSALTLQKMGNAGLTNVGAGDLRSGQWASIAFTDATHPVLLNPLGQFVHASDLANSALSFGLPVNLQINASVSANALTVALKTSSGADPTATTPILVPFRDVTIANGDPVVVPVAAASGLTVASLSTMGCVSGQMCRLWTVLFNNAGTVQVCLFNALSGTSIAPINEAALQTSASGTSGGSSAQTYYCNASAVTAKAIRIVGYVEIQEVTAGTWATGPTYTQLFGPGIKKPGDTVQIVVATSTSGGTTTSASFAALSGGLTAVITPSSAANVVRARTEGLLQGTGSNVIGLIKLARGGSAIGNYTGSYSGSGNSPQSIALTTYDLPNAITSQTYSLLGNTGGSGTLTYPSSSAGVIIELMELQTSLEPANDNGALLKMVG